MISRRHSFTLKANTLHNRLVSSCWVYKSWTPEEATPPPRRRQYNALWDTGATNSMVSKQVVEDLGLDAEGFTNIYHVGGESVNTPQYFVNLVLFPEVHFPSLTVAEGLLLGADVLIGMDIINRGDFAVSNRNGATSFSFRIPSVADFDFAAEDNQPGASGAAGYGE